jgi:hypothetical protein
MPGCMMPEADGGMPMMRMMMDQGGMPMMAKHIDGRLAFLKTTLEPFARCPYIGSAVGDRVSERSGCLGARLLQSTNSESIMAGRRSLISRSTSQVSVEIWLTSAAIG